MPLTGGFGAHIGLHRPVGQQGDARALHRPAAGAFIVAGDAQTAQRAVRAVRETVHIRQSRRAAQHAGRVERVEGHASRRHIRDLLGRDQVAQPDIDRREVQIAGGGIHQPLHHVQHLGLARAAIGIDGGGVGQHPLHHVMHRLHVVEPPDEVGGERGVHPRAIAGGEGAQIGERAPAQAQKPPVGGEGGLGLGPEIARLHVGQQRLGPGGGPAHGPRQILCGQRAERVFGVIDQLHPEAAADIGRVNAHPVGRHAQVAGDIVAGGVHALIGYPDLPPRVGVVAHRDAARLDRADGETLVAHACGNDAVGRGEGRVRARGIAHLPAEDAVARQAVADRRGCRRRARIGEGGQVGDLDLHQFGGVARLLRRRGEDDRHRLPDIGHLALGQMRLRHLQERRAVGLHHAHARADGAEPPGDVARGPRRRDAGMGARGIKIDGGQPAARHVRPHEGRAQGTSQRHVVHKEATPGQQTRILGTLHGLSDAEFHGDSPFEG